MMKIGGAQGMEVWLWKVGLRRSSLGTCPPTGRYQLGETYAGSMQETGNYRPQKACFTGVL
eukprot:1161425-Pelagomonas_calceolata.AAC.13